MGFLAKDGHFLNGGAILLLTDVRDMAIYYVGMNKYRISQQNRERKVFYLQA
jgi:hypothetical protein